MIKKILNSTFLRGSLVFSISSFLVSFLNYLFNLIIAKGFSLENYGEYMSALSYMLLLAVPLSAFNLVVIKKIGRVEYKYRKEYILALEHWFFAFIKENFTYIFIFGVLSFIFLRNFSNLSSVSLVFIYLSSLLNVYSNFYLAAFQGLKSFWLIGKLSAFAGIFKITAALLAIKFFASISSLYLIILLSFLVVIFMGRQVLYTNLKPNKRFEIQLRSVLHYLKNKMILISLFSGIGSTGIITVDLILVKKFFQPEEVGLYAALSLLARIIFYLSIPISTVAYTFFTGRESKKSSNKILALSILLLVMIFGASLITYLFFPHLVIKIIFDQRYLVLSNYLWLAAVLGGVYSLMITFLNYHIAKGHLLSLLAFVGILVQAAAISIFNTSFLSVLLVNISVVSCLLLIFGLRFLIDIKNKKD